MKKLSPVFGLIVLLAWGSATVAAELSNDFYRGICIAGPQKSLGSHEKRAYELKNRAFSSLPADEKWEARDFASQYSNDGLEKMPPAKVRRFKELMEKAARALSPGEREEVERYGKLIREGKAAAPSQGLQPSGRAGSVPSGEGLHVKKYSRDDLLGLIEQTGKPGSPGGALLDELRLAGLVAENGGKTGNRESRLASVKDFSFHGKGRFQFLKYSEDGKSLFVSYMYPSKDRDREDYDPRISSRSVLARWDAATGRLAEVFLSEKNAACAVAMSRDDRIALYHLDLPGAEKLKDSSYETVKNLLYSLEIAGEIGAPGRIVSLARGDDVLFDAFPVLENITMSPDGRYVAFSAPFKDRPGEGNTIIVETAGGKRHFYPYAYGSGTPGSPNAASMVFSPDGKQLAMGIPSKVEKSGVAEVAIKIINTNSWEEVRKIPPVTTGFQLGSFIYSPDGRYLVRFVLDPARREFIAVDTGKIFYSLPYKDLVQCFSPDGRFYLNFSPGRCDIACVDKQACFWLPSGYYPQYFDGGVRQAAFSPDGRRIALAGAMKGAHTLQIIDFKEPGEKQTEVFRRAESALLLYLSGMQKEALAVAEEVIKTDPLGLYSVDYNKRLADIAMPIFLRGELCLGAYRQASLQKNNRLGLHWKQGEAGMTVTKVNQNTPAQRAGFAVGDVVKVIGGKQCATERAFLAVWNGLVPDQPAELEILRNGSPMTLRILPIKAYSKYSFDILMEYAQTALEAGRPSAALEAAGLASGWIREGRLYTDRGMEERLLIVEASALASTGKEQQAFDLLRAHQGFEKYGSADGSLRLQPGAFYPLLKERKRLASAMGFEESYLFPEPRNPGPPQPYPDMTGKR